ncbi:hypothetical protein F7725_026645, partial [Dissostichus mawsoni]
MFESDLYDQRHIQNQTSVALTVFAVGRFSFCVPFHPYPRFLDAYLKTFLTSAEQHFMLGLKVTYYVFTDLPEKVPSIELAPNRTLKIEQVEKHSRWQDISMIRMKTISDAIESEIHHHCNYVFCFDVDQEFKGRFGSEALGDSVALLHAWYYNAPNNLYTYDRNPRSKAFMETGDYYYNAAVFGGLLENVKSLTDYCFLNIMEDKLNNVEALWHDESHLNKYFWLNKPSRLLSPEYCWDQFIMEKRDIHIIRLIRAPRNDGGLGPDTYILESSYHLGGDTLSNTYCFCVPLHPYPRYLDAYLKTFLTSAEQHFMLGLKKVPSIELAPNRNLKIIAVEKHSRWQDISMIRMKTISDAIESEIHHHCNYVFCFDVDQEFKGRFGSEALGDSVALLHAWYYNAPNNLYTYDRNPRSKAFMETGDYYYNAAVFGGLLEKVKNLTDYCFLNIMEDKLNNVEALWHDESHLNKYFWINKPSRLLSPEYCWDQVIMEKRDIN